MKAKTIITTALLLFVLGSAVYLVVEEVGSESPSPPSGADSPAVAGPNEPSQAAKALKVVLYYFHGTFRCPTCRKFESFSNEVLQGAFAEELDDGRLEWRVVNVDEPGNEHFVSDYQLHTRALVLVKIRDGKQAAWKNLKRIWELVRDKRAFVTYVQNEVGSYLEAD